MTMGTATPPPAATGLSPRLSAERFLFSLYPAGPGRGEWFELRCLDCSSKPAQPGPRQFFRSLTQLVDAALPLAAQWDVFFGVGLRRCPAVVDITKCPHQVRGEDHISRLPAAWVDLDVASADEPDKPYASLIEALDALYELPAAPDLVVGSGTGLHGYWVTTEPRLDLAGIVATNRRLRGVLRGDNAIDAARILRLPGTLNHKHGEPALPVTLIQAPEPRS